MKKALSLLLLLLLCTGICITASAEENNTITFRGIPWGSSPEEAIQLLKDDLGEENIEVGSLSKNQYPYATNIHGNKNASKLPMLFCSIKVSNCMAAGYEIKSIVLYFLPKISADQQSFELSETEAALWKAEYSLIVPQTLSSDQLMLDDVIGKLNTIYGDATTENIKWNVVRAGKGKSTTSCLHHIWQDEEHQIYVCPQIQKTMSLTYIQKPVFSIQQTIKDIIQKEEEAKLKPTENPINSSTDGL